MGQHSVKLDEIGGFPAGPRVSHPKCGFDFARPEGRHSRGAGIDGGANRNAARSGSA
jgi:hypothetical protein